MLRETLTYTQGEKHKRENANYISRTPEEIKKLATYFDEWHFMLHSFNETHPGIIKSDLDRGTIWYQKEMYTPDELDLLGRNKDKDSMGYGVQEGPHKMLSLIAEVENLRHGTTYTKENIAMMPGAWAGLEYALQQILHLRKGQHQGNIAIIGPTLFQMFYSPIEHFGFALNSYDFVREDKPHIPLSIDDMEDIFASKPKAIVITNPTNPDGIYFKSELLRQMIQRAEDEKVYIVIDEIQNCFPQPNCGLKYGRWIQSHNVIRVDGPAKRNALADSRVGWIIADNTILTDNYSVFEQLEQRFKEKIKTWFHNNLSHLSCSRLEGTIGRMSGIIGNAPKSANTLLTDIFQQEKEVILACKKPIDRYPTLSKKYAYVLDRLKTMPRIKAIFEPEACVNITIQCDYPGTDLDLSVELMENGTLIMPTAGYGYPLESCTLRITFAERDFQLKHSMDVLEKVLSGY